VDNRKYDLLKRNCHHLVQHLLNKICNGAKLPWKDLNSAIRDAAMEKMFEIAREILFWLSEVKMLGEQDPMIQKVLKETYKQPWIYGERKPITC
jgi:hypothetical protein